MRRTGAPISVDYLFRATEDDEWRVFDVIVEGVSFVQTFRTQFDEQLRTQTLDEVTVKLRAGRLATGD